MNSILGVGHSNFLPTINVMMAIPTIFIVAQISRTGQKMTNNAIFTIFMEALSKKISYNEREA
jgi:hypothetical protein